MRRWLHCLLVALLCLTLFVDSARACWFLRQRSRRGSCPPPSCQPTCSPVVRHVSSCQPTVVVADWGCSHCGHAAPPVIHHGTECGCGLTVADGEVHVEHVHGGIVHDHAVTREGSAVAGNVVGEQVTGGQSVVENGPAPAVVTERGTTNAPVVDRTPVNTSERPSPAAASVVERPAQRSNAEQPLALPATPPSTAIAPAPTATQPAAVVPSLIQPAAGQVPAAVPVPTDADATTAAEKPAAPAAEPTEEPADDGASPKPATDDEPMEEEAPIGADDDDFPAPRRPARKPAPVDEPEMTEEPEEPAADAEPAPAKPARKPAPKPAVDNLFDDAEDEPADPTPTNRALPDADDDAAAPATEEKTDEQMEETEPGADEPADGDAAAPAADGDEPEMVEEPAEEGDSDAAPAADGDEPEMVEEPAEEGDSEAAPAADGDEPEMVEEADGEPAAADAAEPADDAADAAEPTDDAAPPKADADSAAVEPAEPLRRWTDSSNSHETRGWLVGMTSTHVRILKVNGRHSTVAIDVLSLTDQSYVTDVAVKIAARRQAPAAVVKTAGL